MKKFLTELSVDVQLEYDSDYVIGGGEFSGTGATVQTAFSPTSEFITSIVLKPQDAEGTENWNRGEMQLTAVDGSSLRINPIDGNPDNFNVSVNGSTEIVVRNWAS